MIPRTQLSRSQTAFVTRAKVGPFLMNGPCNSKFISRVPRRFKVRGINVRSLTAGNRSTADCWKRVAGALAPRGSIRELVVAALYWFENGSA